MMRSMFRTSAALGLDRCIEASLITVTTRCTASPYTRQSSAPLAAVVVAAAAAIAMVDAVNDAVMQIIVTIC